MSASWAATRATGSHQSAGAWRLCWPGQRQLSFLYGRGGELQSGQNVSPLQIRIVGEDLIEAASGGKLAKNGADRHPGVPDAGKTAHSIRIEIRSYAMAREYASQRIWLR